MAKGFGITKKKFRKFFEKKYFCFSISFFLQITQKLAKGKFSDQIFNLKLNFFCDLKGKIKSAQIFERKP